MSFPFRSSCSFNDRDATDSFSLLLSWGEFSFWRGRRDVRIWNLDPLEGFSCNSSFRCQLDHSPSREYIFPALWRIKFPKSVILFI